VPTLVVVAFVLIGLALNGLLIHAAARIAKQFVSSPAPPARPPVTGTWPQVFKAALLRLVLVIAVQLALVETLEQVSVQWKESTSELWGTALAVATLGGLAWACWPGYRLKRSWGFWAGGIVGSSVLLLGLDNFYTWQLRPNLGLYREPDWVAQHPGFQRQLLERIEGNLWREPGAGPPATVEPPPVVVQTVPPSGASDVDPAVADIRITFSKPMQDHSWSWRQWDGERFAEAAGEPHYLADGRTCVLPVKLEPGRVYTLWLNDETHREFKDAGGQPALPYLLIFETRR
jgi:RNA polymerase sigma-70 factor (ECF subfamily)